RVEAGNVDVVDEPSIVTVAAERTAEARGPGVEAELDRRGREPEPDLAPAVRIQVDLGLDPAARTWALTDDRCAVRKDLGEAVRRRHDLALVGIVGRVLRVAGAAVDEFGEAEARRPE